MSKFASVRLHELARLYNIQTAYYDVSKKRHQASENVLSSVLNTLGVSVASPSEVTLAIRGRKQSLCQRVLEPVTVIWSSREASIKACIPAKPDNASITGNLELETGETHTFKWSADDLFMLDSMTIEGITYVVKQIVLAIDLPLGYHKFSLEIGANRAETLIISAPDKAYRPADEDRNRTWGIFVPLYALQDKDSPGSGDYSVLGSLTEWVSNLGGRTVATLPLLPTFLDEPFEPSPYAPVSRLLWNEFYISLNDIPELSGSSQAQMLLQSSSVLSEIKDLHDAPLVDYRCLMALKRRVLEECCRFLVTEKSGRFREFHEFINKHPVVNDYACFRATMEKQRPSWQCWSERLRAGVLCEGDYGEENRLYYMYAQWLAHQQIDALAIQASKRRIDLYFDLPLGTHPEGYDVWREHENFTLGATVGAPPDTVFTGGQNWLFPPVHPERIREQGYRYYRAYIQHHLRHAGMLRIDHVMGLHRQFWIPKGIDPKYGVYVRYRAEEQYSILSLESHRNRCVIVGEDLGTVPAYVRPAMSRHGLQRMYVLHYELADNSTARPHLPQHNHVASLNTHDMPPFASFYRGTDIRERLDAGLLDMKGAQIEKRARHTLIAALAGFLRTKKLLAADNGDIFEFLKACLAFLSRSRARTVLINLEDLWLETRSQNLPGTRGEHPNWCRKARHTLENIQRIPEIRDTLKEIDRIRKQGVK